jgi:hypothetical protein
MANLPLATSDWRRVNAREPVLHMRNRFFEQNPTGAEQVALLARPGLRRAIEVGDGPIRGMYHQPGVFNDDLFVVSDDRVFRVNSNLIPTQIGVIEPNEAFDVEMVATARFGTTSEYLFIADGVNLWFYAEIGFARGTLTGTSIADNDNVVIGSVHYRFTNGTVNVPGANGTSGDPWMVRRGTTLLEGFTNLANALDALNGVPGTDYTINIAPHPTVTQVGVSGANMLVRAREAGTAGNLIATTETGANINWLSATLADGGTPQFSRIIMPDDIGAVSVDVLANFVIVVPTQSPSEGINGRWYYIEPGEIVVRPDNFFTAEKSPDKLEQVRVVGDQAWFFGASSTEVWYPTGDENFVFAPVQGQVFDRGIWNGTAVRVKDAVMVVDLDGVVYEVTNGPRRVSTHAVEEQIVKAIALSL